MFSVRQPKIIGDSWFNLPTGRQVPGPDDFSGKVVLYDFWTYSCINCQRTLPYIKEWWKRYKDKGLMIVGIHTPEFEFEKDPENVKAAIKDLGVEWPVVEDNDFINWNNFANHYWPAKYLASKTGEIVYEHFGEGAYAETEKKIQELLMESGAKPMPEVRKDEHAHGNVCFIPTPETYCGYGRGFLSNEGGYKENEVFEYQAPAKIREDSIGLAHKFVARGEYVESASTGSALLLNFRATEVNLVMAAPNGEATIVVKLDGKLLGSEVKGRDVSDSGDVTITKSTLYNLVKARNLVNGFLTIEAKEGIFQAYAFTFSGCEE